MIAGFNKPATIALKGRLHMSPASTSVGLSDPGRTKRASKCDRTAAVDYDLAVRQWTFAATFDLPINHRTDSVREIGGANCRQDTGQHVHGIMGTEDENAGRFEQSNCNAPIDSFSALQTPKFNSSVNCNSSMAGEEEIIRDAIRHEQ